MIQFFIVFHKNIFDECYKNIPADILTKYFTFIAVNEKIPKIYTPNKYKIINEWDLPIYDKTFQERGYNENSALYHVYVNKLYLDYKYVGFFQYDMEFPENIVSYMDKNMNNSKCCAIHLGDFNFCSYRTWNEPKTLQYIINDYEKFFNTTFSKDYQYPLCNSFIISIENYEKIMKWLVELYDKLYPWCIQPPNASHFGHIGGIYERIMAYAIGQERLEYLDINIIHDHKYKHQTQK
jgi:hypothetical protein